MGRYVEIRGSYNFFLYLEDFFYIFSKNQLIFIFLNLIEKFILLRINLYYFLNLLPS